MPWLFVLPTFTRYVGRRIPFIMSSFVMMAVFVILYSSTSTTQIFVAEIMQGFFHAGNMTVTVFIISEYTSPKYRGMFLTIKSASFFWGIWVANTIGTFFHWKYIAAFGILCCCHNFTSFFWPESPHWLASRGRFAECKASHRWLHDSTEGSEQELNQLIKSQTEYQRNQAKTSSAIFAQYTRKEFYKPLLLMTISVTQYHFSGKLVCSIYILEILKKITKSESTAYTGMLILDGVPILGMYTGCFLSKLLGRRVLYLGSSALSVSFLLLISLYLYLVRLSLLNENETLSILLFTCFSLSVGCGPMIMTTTVYGEITPSANKATFCTTVALIYATYSTGLLKIAPWVFDSLGQHGTFLFYAVATSLCTLLLYLYLPETKDKTLQEIEEDFKSGENKGTALTAEENELFVANKR